MPQNESKTNGTDALENGFDFAAFDLDQPELVSAAALTSDRFSMTNASSAKTTNAIWCSCK